MLFGLVTPPAEEPVTLAEAKNHLRLETDEDNGMVTMLITAARQYIEERCWRGLVTQTWRVVLDGFPYERGCRPADQQGILLPRGNLAAINSVKYIDGNGVEQTLDPSEYVADQLSVPGGVRLAYAKSWPGTRSQWDAVRIEYDVGWEAASVPAPLRQGLLLVLAQMYEHRTPEVVGTIVSPVDFTVDALLAPYRLARFL